MAAKSDDPLVAQLLALLHGGHAHASFDTVVADFPVGRQGIVPENLPYSAWQIVEHLRVAQRDILLFSAPPTGGYQPMTWPDDYWPREAEPPTVDAWSASLASIRADQASFEALLTRPNVDLHKPFLWGQGQNLLREALLISDHNAYHLGELVVLRRLLGIWNPK